MEDKEKKREELLVSIANERNTYFDIIKNGLYKEKYEYILNFIKTLSKNTSSPDVTKLIDYIKEYITKNEVEHLNKLKSAILDYNYKITNELYKDSSEKPTIDEKLFINQVLIGTNDLIGCHVFYFISKVFENCAFVNWKSKYKLFKEDLLKCIQNLEEEFIKMKKENEIID